MAKIIGQQEFSFGEENIAPLADRMRPRTLRGFIGQGHVISANSLLSRAIKMDTVGSCIFWGPPGTGKTTLAGIIANSTGSPFVKLNAVLNGVADAKAVLEKAENNVRNGGKPTYLLLDECHRWNKAQSDSLLQAVEKGIIVFIGSTTENPYVAMTPAIVSRCRVFEFRRLGEEDVRKALENAVNSDKLLRSRNVSVTEGALRHIARVSGGDLRNAYNILELAAFTTEEKDGKVVVTEKEAAESSQTKPLSVGEDTYYDMISAFCKSLRGSDENAALFWYARLISAGCDPMLPMRRLMVHSAEYVGIADPRALLMTSAALSALKNVGMPEARIPIGEAIIYVCRAPKSNSVVTALDAAFADAEKYADLPVPNDLVDTNYPRSTDAEKPHYRYPHDYGGWCEQTYLPEAIANHVYYRPSSNGEESEPSFREKFVGKRKKS